MGFYGDRILPRIIDKALNSREVNGLRARATTGLSGEVLEVGFGSGRNVVHYPDGVTRVRAVDPATLGRKLAEPRVAARGIPVDYVGLDGADLDIGDACIDHVLSTWTLCTIPDVERALAEIRRVLRPGGEFHFLEHGKSPTAKVARWQDRITPVNKLLFGGCHPNRPMDRLLADCGLELTRMENLYMKGPKMLGYMFEGVATKR
jgi:ubiquinone/menaquinone biosynthesis C-methylase UbiE